jgi:hypothetical protein
MPQPLSRVAPTATLLIANAGMRPLTTHNPKLGLMAMEAIISWSNVETFLLDLYVQLLGGVQEMAVIAYLALEQQSAKTAVIQAIAKEKLSEENQKLLNAILAVSKTAQKGRDKLAH